MEHSFVLESEREKQIIEVLANWADEIEGPKKTTPEKVALWAKNALDKKGNRAISHNIDYEWISFFWKGADSQINLFLSNRGLVVRVLMGKDSKLTTSDWRRWTEKQKEL